MDHKFGEIMKILVTGGAGFIGSHVVDKYIDMGHEVVIIDNMSTGKEENINPKAKFINIDITDEKIIDIFKDEKFDIINHHAAQMDVRVSVNDPKFDARTNIIGGLNLYEAAKETGVKKIIFASSGGTVYGEQEQFPAGEDHPTRPCSPYGISKLSNEKYLFYYKEVYNIDYVALRYANVYGPRQNPHGEAGVVAIFTNKLLAGEQPKINGDGKNTRDYVFADDVAKANEIALNDDVSGIFNVGTGIETDVNEIFTKLNEITNANCAEIHGPAKAGEQKRSVISFNKFNMLHSWKPMIDFNEGLHETVKFFKSKLDN
jgi:UDP-glucose 4-epimerase